MTASPPLRGSLFSMATSLGCTSAHVPSSPPLSSRIRAGRVKYQSIAASPFRGFKQFLWDCLVHCDIEFVELEEKYIQQEELTTSLGT